MYYAGHGSTTLLLGRLNFNQDPKRGGGNGIVPFRPIKDILNRTEADVLLLLDCCFAASAMRSIHKGTKILIAACDAQSKTIGPGPTSFTSTLIEALKEQSPNTSVKSIYTEMKSARKQLRKSSRTPDGDKLYIHAPKFIDFSDEDDDIKLVAV